MARLSIIAPTYNHARHLPAMVEAVLGQSRLPDEFRIGDDLSPDETPQVLAALAVAHPLLRATRNERNLGVCAAFNYLAEEATGDYLLTTATDDRILPGAVEAAMRVAEAHPEAGLACGQSVWWNEATDDQYVTGLAMPDRDGYLDPETCIALARRGCLDITGQSAFFKRGLYLAYGGLRPELRWHSDWFLIHVIAFRHGVAWTPAPISVWRGHQSGYSHPGKQAMRERKAVYGLMADILGEPGYADVARGFARSGVLAYYGLPILGVLLRKPSRWHLVSLPFLWAQARGQLRKLSFLRNLVRRFRPVPKRIAHTGLDLSSMR